MKKKKTKPTNRRNLYIGLGIFFVLVGFSIPFYLIVGALFLWLAWRANKNTKKPEPAPAPVAPTTRQVAPEATPAAVAPVAPTTRPAPKTYKVTGMQYRMENLMALAEYNPFYDWSKKELIDELMTNERVYQYTFNYKKAELVSEPDNPHDPKAIKVVVGGLHVGYIKAGSCAHLHKVINENRIERIDCEISGGKYKVVLECWDDLGGNSKYTLERGDAPFWVHLHIVEREV